MFGWGAVMVQFNCSIVQMRSYCQRFSTRPARYGLVLVRSVNMVLGYCLMVTLLTVLKSMIHIFVGVPS